MAVARAGLPPAGPGAAGAGAAAAPAVGPARPPPLQPAGPHPIKHYPGPWNTIGLPAARETRNNRKRLVRDYLRGIFPDAGTPEEKSAFYHNVLDAIEGSPGIPDFTLRRTRPVAGGPPRVYMNLAGGKRRRTNRKNRKSHRKSRKSNRKSHRRSRK